MQPDEVQMRSEIIWNNGCSLIDEAHTGNLSDADMAEFIATMERLAERMKHMRDI